MATIRLMLEPPATRTIPIGDKHWYFSAKKWLSGVPEEVAQRCRAINKAEGREVFEILHDSAQLEVKVKPEEVKPKVEPKAPIAHKHASEHKKTPAAKIKPRKIPVTLR